MEEGEEKKGFLESIFDGVRDAFENAVEQAKSTIDKLLGREEGEEGEGEKGGIADIIDDIVQWNKDFWDKLLGREGEEGGEGGFDLGNMIRDIRNRIRDVLGMEPLPED